MRRAALLVLLAAGCARGTGERLPSTLSLRVEGAPGYVLVTLTGKGGTPVAGLYDRRVDLDPAGRADLRGLPPGDYALRLSTLRQFREERGYDAVHAAGVTLGPGRVAEHAARLVAGGRVKVTLTDEDGRGVAARLLVRDREGRPVAATFWRGGKGGWTTEHLPLSPAFTSCVLPPGRYRILALRYHVVAASGETEIRAGETADLPLLARGE